VKVPVISGVIERRILINLRVAPKVLSKLLPAPFRPKLVKGWGMAGVCLIRLGEMRPRVLPRAFGLKSENAAHRIAVEWDDGGLVREGVYVHRRDTSSRLSVLVGGTLFPGDHQHATFRAIEGSGRYSVALDSDDGRTHLAVEARTVESLPVGSIFASLGEASAFFEGGAIGFSPSTRRETFDALQLRCPGWKVEALAVEKLESSFFDDRSRFPEGSAVLDCALLMRDLQHEWHAVATAPSPPPRPAA